uniref:Uncharacterized protein n=1 Tax=Oryza punctata TaxID=4537 RepID=A0A0E0KD53_ORYPU
MAATAEADTLTLARGAATPRRCWDQLLAAPPPRYPTPTGLAHTELISDLSPPPVGDETTMKWRGVLTRLLSYIICFIARIN